LLTINSIIYSELDIKTLKDAQLQNSLIKFLHTELGQFRDPEEDIRACLEYILNPALGGHIFTAQEDKDLRGVVLVTNTHMHKFVPGFLLVYIATSSAHRGKGIGKNLMELVTNTLKAPIALHVEHDNPAKRLYERLGFTSKYAEMRWYP
jgi:ribosomal-protein-alanine N-acetyltransferase